MEHKYKFNSLLCVSVNFYDKFYLKRVILAIFVTPQSTNVTPLLSMQIYSEQLETLNKLKLQTREMITYSQSCHRGRTSMKWRNLVLLDMQKCKRTLL
jgi:hypothetical protein